jgi:hypothetical protein
MFKRIMSLAVLSLAAFCLSALAQSGMDKENAGAAFERPLLYAGHFVRESSHGDTRTEAYSLPQDASGPYVLRVTNGATDGSRRMKSARILLNGTEVVSRKQVNSKTEFLWVPVSRLMREQNVLTVIVEGKPGSEMYVTLEDLDAVSRAFTPRPAIAAAARTSAAGGRQ